MNIHERIHSKRIECDMTLEELAKSIKTTRHTVYRYENTLIANIPLSVIESIAKTLHTTPAWILGSDEGKDLEHKHPVNFLS